MKTPFGAEVDLGLGQIVLHGDPALSPAAPPTQKAWIKMPLGTEVGLGPGDIVLDGDPAPSPKRGRAPSPILRLRLRISKLDWDWAALPVIANFVTLEQQIILVKTRSESV